MNLMHYELLPYLSDELIKDIWENLKESFVITEESIKADKEDLSLYTCLVIAEMEKRKFIIFGLEKAIFYFDWDDEFTYKIIPNLKNLIIDTKPFPEQFTDDYLLECYYRLKEKYIDYKFMINVTIFIQNKFKEEL